jgi:hypothetical protein
VAGCGDAEEQQLGAVMHKTFPSSPHHYCCTLRTPI